MNYYQKTSQEICKEFGVNLEEGLSSKQVTQNLSQYGPNILASKAKESLAEIFVRQFKSPLIYILIFASALVLAMGKLVDSLVILAVISLNSVVGTIQEGKARNSLERLKSLTKHKALVRRENKEILISSEELVVGDILILHEGDRVAADGRIIKEEGLRVNESILTGEAYSVAKTSKVIGGKGLVAGDMKNMVFSGTSIVSGNCQVVVVATGFHSELGKISKEILDTSNVPLPLVKKVSNLTHFIAFSVILISGAVLVLGLVKGLPVLELFGAVVGLSVSIVPEGLPVAVTIILARGVWRMAKKKAIVRQMAAVEAMGNANTLLVDKTGTLTSGEMAVSSIYIEGKMLTVSGSGYEPKGEIAGLEDEEKLKNILPLIYLSLDADVIAHEHDGWSPLGDQTEAALAVVCRKAGLLKEVLEKRYKTVFSKPFDNEKRHLEAEFSKGKQTWHVYVGAPDFLIESLKIDDGFKKASGDLFDQGLRVVGAAVYEGDKLYASCLFSIEEDIRHNAADAVLQAKKAGFAVVMMTGDFAQTAKAIAQKVGIFKSGDRVATGDEVEKLSQEALAETLENVTVFARITPSHKLAIVRAYKRLGKVVAMTGDGVNDAPALQEADLGIGLGSGTQVAKDSSDIVLADDNFATIVSAIFEGRGIYLTLKKVILYLFSTSLGEVLAIIGAIMIGLPLPLVAVQIIWLNFVTDGFFVVALAQDDLDGAVLQRSKNELVDRGMKVRMVTMGFSMVFAALPVFYYFLNTHSLEYARSAALVVLSVTQWLNALNVRSGTASVFKTPISNRYIIFSLIAVFALQILVIETSLGNSLLHTQKLDLSAWIIAFLASTLIIWVEEIRKLVARQKLRIKSTEAF